MSNEQERGAQPASPIKTPQQLMVTVILAFVVPIAIIILLVNLVASGAKVGAGSDTLSNEAVAQRIAPVAGFVLVDANAPKVFKTGAQVFAAVCTACHNAGVAGAPKVGDHAAWAPFIQSGFDAMLNVALHGKGGMPPKGGNPALSDYEVARAVVYMANQSGGSLPEPAAPAQADTRQTASAAAPATPATPAAPTSAAPPQTATLNPAGEKLYKSVCFACHATGVANAPKFGDKAAWEPYLKTGMDAMVKAVMQGKPPMPPKGGAANASEDDIRAAVQYMADAAK